jgi:metal-responsive CopG/Arc/MetJ family transcriptional regulator
VEKSMKNVTITMDEKLLERVRVQAAREGKSVSRLMTEAAETLVGKTLTQKEALERFLARPLLNLTIDGKAPSRDELYD